LQHAHNLIGITNQIGIASIGTPISFATGVQMSTSWASVSMDTTKERMDTHCFFRILKQWEYMLFMFLFFLTAGVHAFCGANLGSDVFNVKKFKHLRGWLCLYM
jgi:hypothetical protein